MKLIFFLIVVCMFSLVSAQTTYQDCSIYGNCKTTTSSSAIPFDCGAGNCVQSTIDGYTCVPCVGGGSSYNATYDSTTKQWNANFTAFSQFWYNQTLGSFFIAGTGLQGTGTNTVSANVSYFDDRYANANLVFYFWNTTSSVAGYKVMNITQPNPLLNQVTFSVAGITNLENITSFINSNTNLTGIKSGTLLVHIHATQTTGTQTLALFANIYKRNVANAETLLSTTETSPALTGSLGEVELHAPIATTSLNITDRIVVKIVAVVTGGGTAPTAQFATEGDTDSRLELPIVANQININEVDPIFTAWKGAYQSNLALTNQSNNLTGNQYIIDGDLHLPKTIGTNQFGGILGNSFTGAYLLAISNPNVAYTVSGSGDLGGQSPNGVDYYVLDTFEGMPLFTRATGSWAIWFSVTNGQYVLSHQSDVGNPLFAGWIFNGGQSNPFGHYSTTQGGATGSVDVEGQFPFSADKDGNTISTSEQSVSFTSYYPNRATATQTTSMSGDNFFHNDNAYGTYNINYHTPFANQGTYLFPALPSSANAYGVFSATSPNTQGYLAVWGTNPDELTAQTISSALSGATTDDLPEGSTNKYFSASNLASMATTDNLPEGATNKYFTTANFASAYSGVSDTYDDGVDTTITFTQGVATAISTAFDDRLMQNITYLSNLTGQLNPIKFQWNKDGIKQFKNQTSKSGWIYGYYSAQDVQLYYPECIVNVNENVTGKVVTYLTYDRNCLNTQLIASKDATIKSLQSKLDRICALPTMAGVC